MNANAVNSVVKIMEAAVMMTHTANRGFVAQREGGLPTFTSPLATCAGSAVSGAAIPSIAVVVVVLPAAFSFPRAVHLSSTIPRAKSTCMGSGGPTTAAVSTGSS